MASLIFRRIDTENMHFNWWSRYHKYDTIQCRKYKFFLFLPPQCLDHVSTLALASRGLTCIASVQLAQFP